MVKTSRCGESQELLTTSQEDRLMEAGSYDENDEKMFNLLSKNMDNYEGKQYKEQKQKRKQFNLSNVTI